MCIRDRSQTRNHPNADLADLCLSDDMIELLKSGLVDNSLLCELATHPDFPRLMADLEIYVNGVAGKQVQSANAIVDAEMCIRDRKLAPCSASPAGVFLFGRSFCFQGAVHR